MKKKITITLDEEILEQLKEYAKEEDLIFLCGHYAASFFSRERISRPSASVSASNH